MAKYFVFLFVEDARLRQYLDLAIYALNPREKWPAHVTVAGPFARKIEAPRALEFEQEVSILGRGRFENGVHHTVYLHVGSPALAAHIQKPDYKNAIPHLSLYNGRDAIIAEELYSALGEYRPFGVFRTRRLAVVESKQQFSFDFPMHIQLGLLDSTRDMSLEQMKHLDTHSRVRIAIESLRAGLRRPFDLLKALNKTPTTLRSQ